MTDISTQLDILADLVAIPTVPGENNEVWLSYVATRLSAAGCRVTQVPSKLGDCTGLIASVGPEIPGGLILSGHVDVVSVEGQDWTGDPFRLRRSGGRVLGRGTSDMKGFVSCAIAAMEDRARNPSATPLHIALSADEESTCQSAVSLAEFAARWLPAPRGVLIGEPTLLHPVSGHKGSYTYEVAVTGRPAHASMPELGASATALAARLIAWLDDQSAKVSSPNSTTHSVGRIKGGTASNIIAAQCRFDWDIRLAPGDDLGAILQAFEAVAQKLCADARCRMPEVDVRLQQTAAFPSFRTDAASPLARECLVVSEISDTVEMVAATEAGIFQTAGFPVVVMGPGDMAQAHTPDEFVELDQLAGSAAQLRRLI